MNAFIEKTNSWHWLSAALALCLLLTVYPYIRINQKVCKKHAPKLLAQRNYLSELELLSDADVLTLARQTEKMETRFQLLEKEVKAWGGDPVPAGEGAVLVTMNIINQMLLDNGLRLISCEPVAERFQKSDSKKADAFTPFFETRDLSYVVEGHFKHVFLFWVKQSFLKPAHHYKDIHIRRAPGNLIHLAFVAQVNFKDKK